MQHFKNIMNLTVAYSNILIFEMVHSEKEVNFKLFLMYFTKKQHKRNKANISQRFPILYGL